MILKIRTGTIEEILSIDALIPEFDTKTTKEKLISRLAGNNNLVLVASINDQLVAYKIGYERSSSVFYSWIGGVIPEYRKKGIATKLRKYQELWATKHGYKVLSVKSMNKYPAMLQLLISSGYKIYGYENNGNEDNSKIKFKKKLHR